MAFRPYSRFLASFFGCNAKRTLGCNGHREGKLIEEIPCETPSPFPVSRRTLRVGPSARRLALNLPFSGGSKSDAWRHSLPMRTYLSIIHQLYAAPGKIGHAEVQIGVRDDY